MNMIFGIVTLYFANIGMANEKLNDLLNLAHQMLDRYEVSYEMGGKKLSSPKICQQCSQCLLKYAQERVTKNKALCEPCKFCTLDCSNFIHLVMNHANLSMPYLNSEAMLRLTRKTLREKYNFFDLGSKINRSQPGDILVYKGHVVLLVAKSSPDTGNIIHVTSGRSLKGPGMALQKQTNINLNSIKGQVRRILRHRLIGNANISKGYPLRPHNNNHGIQ